MDIMSGRAIALRITLEKLKAGTLLNWHVGVPCTADDVGIYYFIPLLGYFLNISSPLATSIFWLSIISSALLVGATSIFLLYKNWLARLLTLFFLFNFATAIYQAGDLYIAAPALTVALIPLAIYLIDYAKKSKIHFLLIFLCGITIGIFHFIRSYSDVPILAFMLFLLIFNKKLALKLKTGLILCLAIGALMPFLCFKSLLHRDAVYLKAPEIAYLSHHPFWHPVYLGLGYLPNNPYGIKWDDSVAANKVASIQKDVAFNSPLYESILRTEVFKIVKTNPLFVAQTIFAKAIDLFKNARGYLITAILLSIFFPKGWRMELGFWGLLFLSALPGLLVIPFTNYVLGFIAAALVYMLVSIGYALNKVGDILLQIKLIKKLADKIIIDVSPRLSFALASILTIGTIICFIITTVRSPYF